MKTAKILNLDIPKQRALKIIRFIKKKNNKLYKDDEFISAYFQQIVNDERKRIRKRKLKAKKHHRNLDLFND